MATTTYLAVLTGGETPLILCPGQQVPVKAQGTVLPWNDFSVTRTRSANTLIPYLSFNQYILYDKNSKPEGQQCAASFLLLKSLYTWAYTAIYYLFSVAILLL